MNFIHWLIWRQMFYNCYYFARHSSHKIETKYRRNATVWKTPFCSCCWHRSSFLRVRNISDFYRPQRSCGQGNIFTPVCHSFCSQGGVCFSACWDNTPPWEQTPPLGGDPLGSRHPQEQTPPPDTPQSRHPPGSKLRHTVNDRPVRILLECILV